MAARFDYLLPAYTADELAAERWGLVVVEGVKFFSHAVSDLGRVRNLATGLILKPLWCHALRGEASVYWRVCISRGPKGARERKAYLVHRLVAEVFVPGKTPLRNVVNHKDGVTYNPRATNLEWVTTSENIAHYYQMKRAREAMEEFERRHAPEDFDPNAPFELPEIEPSPDYGEAPF